MAWITATAVRELRDMTGAGMMECKRALEKSGGDLEAAQDELRKSGLKTAAKKAGRDTGEGRIASRVSDDGHMSAMVAVACETDFVAKTPEFEAFIDHLCEHVLEHAPADVPEAMGQSWRGDGTVEGALKALVAKLGENIKISQVQYYENPEGRTATYVHHDKMKGAIVDVTTAATGARAGSTLKDLCMHIVALDPDAADRDEIPADLVEREKAIIREGLKGKPEEVQEKIMVGRLEKFFAQRVLGEQAWIKDDHQRVSKALTSALGDGTRLVRFARFQVGA